MIPGIATSSNADGSEREQYCEILRIFRKDKKVLVRFPGNPVAYVKAIENVRVNYRGYYSGYGGRAA